VYPFLYIKGDIMTTNKTTNKNTNTATMIDENRFFKCVAPFLFSHSQVIPEMIENAIRAKSSSVKIQTKDLLTKSVSLFEKVIDKKLRCMELI
jgi:hypothetical protein